MFSLTAARILDNDANETNYKSIFNQLTGLTIDQNSELEVNPPLPRTLIKVGTLGFDSGNTGSTFSIFPPFTGCLFEFCR